MSCFPTVGKAFEELFQYYLNGKRREESKLPSCLPSSGKVFNELLDCVVNSKEDVMTDDRLTVGRIDLGPTEPHRPTQTEQRMRDAELRVVPIRTVESTETVPDSLYELMAEAMLDPKLRRVLVHEGVVYKSGTLPTGNAVRVEVLQRALAVAKAQGWELRKAKEAAPDDGREWEHLR